MAKKPEDSCILKVRVQPKASRNQVDGFEDDTLRLRVTAPPTEGKANAGVIALVAKTLGVSKSRLEIVRGHGSRAKVVAIDTLSEQEVHRRIAAVIKD
ncbi:MAG TPA: YggU family protein [Dehalococcoidia bacterium]|nr:YggU family protein [Dehalococcoidia bacterium]HIN24067.1 YggU family protein [Dehalococcoidia bacterium]